MERRTLLRRLPLAGVVGLAGCIGGDGENDATARTTVSPTATESEPTTAAETETATETVAETETPTAAETATETETPTTTATPSEPQSSVTVSVGASGDLRFAPAEFVLQRGGTVTWEWESSGHNVVVESRPDGADWSGTPGGKSRTFDSGYTHEVTFETAGRYEYVCQPHRRFGMTGAFTVE
jgi:plastocyanin